MIKKMKAPVFFLFSLLLLTADGFNLFRPTSQQVKLARKQANKRKPPPVAPPTPPEENPFLQLPTIDIEVPDLLTPSAWNSMTSAILGFAASLAPKQVRKKSARAAQISINRIPPQSFQFDLSDVPLLGTALSGTYAKVKEVKNPSVVITAPMDKLGFVRTAAEKGNVDLGLNGLFSTNVEIQLEPNRPGVAPLELKSPLIPKWPFGRRKSDWNKVTNMGNGETYYFNSKSGEVQYDEPDQIY